MTAAAREAHLPRLVQLSVLHDALGEVPMRNLLIAALLALPLAGPANAGAYSDNTTDMFAGAAARRQASGLVARMRSGERGSLFRRL